MNTKLPIVALVAYPSFSPFHFSVPYMVFGSELPEGRLFDLKIVSSDAQPLAAERALLITRLPELPVQFPNPTLTVHITFEYQR